jgi:hypothetical protein
MESRGLEELLWRMGEGNLRDESSQGERKGL